MQLNGADNTPVNRVDVAAGQALHVIQLSELAAIVRRRVRHELLMLCACPGSRIDEKQNALSATELSKRYTEVMAVKVLPEPVAI